MAILKKSETESGTWYSPDDGLFKVHCQCGRYDILERVEAGEYWYVCTVDTLAEARRLTGRPKKQTGGE